MNKLTLREGRFYRGDQSFIDENRKFIELVSVLQETIKNSKFSD